MTTQKLTISELVTNSGCFDLQFRKDTRHERTGSPTYYRWKIQFIITLPKDSAADLEKVKKTFGCGKVSVLAGQARFSVQDIDEVFDSLVPYFQKNLVEKSRRKEFELWQKAAEIIYNNKGVYISKWQKSDLLKLLEIHKSLSKYKQKPKPSKWLEMAKTLTKKNED